MKTRPSVVRRATAALIVAIPLLVGASYSLASGNDPADTWSSGAERAGAPATIDDALLVDARRATGEASSQAGLLTGGTKQLAEGTGKIADRTDKVQDAITKGKDGSQKLADGMTEIQAATGQMGQGATKVADGVEGAVNQVVGFEAVRGQIVVAIDNYLEKLKDAQDPDSIKLRDDLQGLRQQAISFPLDENTKTQLEELKTGSRQIAKQLNEPGQPYHDGIYTATKGAKDLNNGFNQLDTELNAALKSVDDLNKGSTQIDSMAKDTKTKIGVIQRALPVSQAGTAEAQAQGVTKTLAPMYAFLIATGVLLGATMRGRIVGKKHILLAALAVAGLSALATILSAVLGAGLAANSLAGIALVAALLGIASLLGGALLVRLFGNFWGQVVSIGGALIQVGIVGWAWNMAVTTTVTKGWLAAASLMPLHYPTSAVAALGNSGAASRLGISIGVLVALCVSGFVGLKLLQPAAVAPTSKS